MSATTVEEASQDDAQEDQATYLADIGTPDEASELTASEDSRECCAFSHEAENLVPSSPDLTVELEQPTEYGCGREQIIYDTVYLQDTAEGESPYAHHYP